MKKYIKYFSIVILLAACSKGGKSELHNEESFCIDSKTKSILEFKTVQKQVVEEGIQLTGSVETNFDKLIHFNSLVNGVISNTFFSLGDAVEKGQVLAEMQGAELSSLQAEMASLKAMIEVAKVDFKSKKAMFEDGIISNKDLLEAKNNLSVLESQTLKTEQILSLYSASNTNNVFQIKAPSTGIVTSKNINIGTTVADEGMPLFSISDLNKVWVMANIYSSDIAKISQGMRVEVRTPSYPDEVYKGKIDVISQVLDEEEKVLKAKIEINNRDLKLKPGMIADIIAFKTTDKKKVAVPTSSLIFYNNKDYILVHKDDDSVETREVNIFAKGNGITYIDSGLSENERIITKNQLLVFEAINN